MGSLVLRWPATVPFRVNLNLRESIIHQMSDARYFVWARLLIRYAVESSEFIHQQNAQLHIHCLYLTELTEPYLLSLFVICHHLHLRVLKKEWEEYCRVYRNPLIFTYSFLFIPCLWPVWPVSITAISNRVSLYFKKPLRLLWHINPTHKWLSNKALGCITDQFKQK